MSEKEKNVINNHMIYERLAVLETMNKVTQNLIADLCASINTDVKVLIKSNRELIDLNTERIVDLEKRDVVFSLKWKIVGWVGACFASGVVGVLVVTYLPKLLGIG